MEHPVGLSHPDRDTPGRNLMMHFGTAATAGVLRAGMSVANLRGGTASFLHTWVRLAIYATGATGPIADALVDPASGTSVQRPSQRLRLPGFA
jgi:hypothetical protein